MNSVARLRLALLLCTVSAGSGCAGDGPPPAPDVALFDRVQRTIFDVHCLASGCHNATDRPNDLVLETGLSHGELVQVQPFNPVARAAGLLRVDPGSPGNSFLLAKLTQQPGAGQGDRMPRGSAPLSAAEVDLVREWILAGAPDSGSPGAAATPEPTATVPPSPTTTATATPTPAETPPTPTFGTGSTFADLQETIFDTSCAVVGCHDAQGAVFSGNLNLEAGVSFSNLVGVVPTNAAAAGMLRVEAGNPDNSFLVTKISLPTAIDPTLGGRMPFGRAPLPEEDRDRIRAWILRGALEDE